VKNYESYRFYIAIGVMVNLFVTIAFEKLIVVNLTAYYDGKN
jgi:hypothetical protein